MLAQSEECANLLAFFKIELAEGGEQLLMPEQFELQVNSLFYNRLEALKEFRKAKHTVVEEEFKREILEKSAADIMTDYERLTRAEQKLFDSTYGKLIEEMMVQISSLPPRDEQLRSQMDDKDPFKNFKVNYRLFNLE